MRTILSIAAAMFAFANAAHADIFQWEYINPADPSQGKQQSTTLAHDGAGVDAVPGADLSYRNLTMAYLIGADLMGAYGQYVNLTNADLSQANLTNAYFYGATLSGADLSHSNLTNAFFSAAKLSGADFTGAEVREAYLGSDLTFAQLYSTASYQTRDLAGIGLYGDLSGWNFAGQNLANANFGGATLTGADFTHADVHGAGLSAGGTSLTTAQLYSTASYQAHDLTAIRLRGDLGGWNFTGQNLTNANFSYATLTDTNFAGAEVHGATFDANYDYNAGINVGGLTLAQLYSTSSYQAHDLSGIGLSRNNLAGGDFAGQNLTDANFSYATLTDADFTGAEVRGADFVAYYDDNTNMYVGGLTLTQLYSTANYQNHDLTGIDFGGNNLSGGNFAGQNLAPANFRGATLTDADFTDAEVRGAHLGSTGITPAQLYTTASYQAHDLSGIDLSSNNLAGANFAGQNLTNANFGVATLTNATLSHANLTNTDFASATLTDADFTGANVRGLNFGAGIYATCPVWGICGWIPGGTGLSPAQLYSTASYQAHDLSGIGLGGNDLSGANFTGQNLTNTDFGSATLTGADFTGAEVRGANFAIYPHCYYGVFGTGITLAQLYSTASYQVRDLRGVTSVDLSAATTTNIIMPSGHIDGLDLDASGLLVVRDYDGNPTPHQTTVFVLPSPLPPIPITIDQHLTIGPGGTLRMVFEADAWDSTISFAPGIPVALGGTLELTFAADVNLASQLGRTLRLFNWTGINPTGSFGVSSPYMWDLSNLYTTGEVTLTAVPEPSALLVFSFALAALVAMGRVRLSSNSGKGEN